MKIERKKLLGLSADSHKCAYTGRPFHEEYGTSHSLGRLLGNESQGSRTISPLFPTKPRHYSKRKTFWERYHADTYRHWVDKVREI